MEAIYPSINNAEAYTVSSQTLANRVHSQRSSDYPLLKASNKVDPKNTLQKLDFKAFKEDCDLQEQSLADDQNDDDPVIF